MTAGRQHTKNPMIFAASQAITASLTDVAGKDLFEFGYGMGRGLAALGAASVSGCDLAACWSWHGGDCLVCGSSGEIAEAADHFV